ncbi:MAG: LytTR family DNA-binding domain-containing protein [Hellea sp.]
MKNNAIKHLTPMIVTSVIAGVILSILAPYGTANFPLATRLAFWTGLCIAGGGGAGGFDLLLAKLKRTIAPWQQALGQSIVSTLMVGLFYFGLSFISGNTPSISGVIITLFYIWVIGITICGIGMLMRTQKAVPEKIPSRPALIERLKPHLRNAEIYAITSEDHYVRVMTSKGDDLILMRLSDAIKEISPLKGLSPHRSWWVAETGVKQVKKSNSKISLLLNNDNIVPVSRNAAKSVREAGWI